MTNTQTVRIDLTSPGGFAPVIHAVAGDIYSRFVRMELYQNGVLYEPPSGTTCVIGWRRGETYGAYSSILEDDGSSSHPAWELEDNVLTIELDWHVCQHPGDVAVNVSLNGEGGSRLHTWELCCRVARGAVADAEDPTKPSESATEAANRAEKAAKDAEAVLGQVDNKIDDAVQGVTDEAKQAAKDAAASAGQAAASAGKVDAALEELDEMLVDGPVVSVNGKTGRVTLTAADVQALGLPAAPKAGQLLVVKSVGEDGSITVGTADSAPGGDTAVQSVNGISPDGTGNVTLPTGVMTINDQEPDGTGNVTLPTGVMTINDQEPDGEGNFELSTIEPRVSYNTTPPYSIQMQPNTLYYLGNYNIQVLNVTLAAPADTTHIAEYHFIFRSGSTATVLNLPQSVIQPPNFEVEPNTVYEVSICENLMLVQSWEVG